MMDRTELRLRLVEAMLKIIGAGSVPIDEKQARDAVLDFERFILEAEPADLPASGLPGWIDR